MRNAKQHLIILLVAQFWASGCTVASMGVHGLSQTQLSLSQGGGGGGGQGQGQGGGATPVIVGMQAHELFSASASQRKVDILFVDDNSASMDPRQASLGGRFATFSNAVQGMDWQIGITTTDCSNDQWGICGSLLTMNGLQTSILNASIANFSAIFDNTIVRPETIGCVARGACPSGISEPIKAAMTAADKRSTDNAGFFRDGASLAIIMLTDADEQNSGPATATQPQDAINHFQAIWGQSKEVKVYAIDIIPGNSACMASDQAIASGDSYYGVGPSTLATMTGGLSESICSADYSPLLQQIGGSLQNQPNVITLAHAPLVNSLSITLNPDSGTKWALNGNVVTFAAALPVGTTITTNYRF